MGVHGLTTYLRENKRVLAKTLHFPTEDGAKIPLVVDGWSFIYKLIQDSDLPWVYGGEYVELARLVVVVVEAWIAVGLVPVVVFDGTTPPAKFTTVVSRLNQTQVQHSLLYFRTSPASRNSRRFLHESRIIPPLAYTVCVQALQDFQNDNDKSLHVHFADEEGDPYAVELAGRLEGFVTGRDSDFVVLNSEGYRGYLPIDDMVWLATVKKTVEGDNGGSDGFTPVKSKKKALPEGIAGTGIVPPQSRIENLSLSATLYTPSSLAQHLNLPVSLLPLLGALVGNDFTTQSHFPMPYATAYTPAATPSSSPPPSTSKTFHNLLFERRLNPSQRIQHAGTTLASFLRPSSGPGKRKQKTPQSVMEIIQMTVAALLNASHAPASLIGSSMQAEIVEHIVEGTLPYAIPNRPLEGEELNGESVCALHTAPTCPLVTLLDRSEDGSPFRAEVAALYLRAYRIGRFSPSLMDILSTGTFWPELFLEDPDTESVSRTISRRVRIFTYALLETGIGLPEAEDDDDDESEGEGEEDWAGEEEEDPDEVIDVIEEDSDYEEDVSDVDRLRGALRGLQMDEEQSEGTDQTGTIGDDTLSESLQSSTVQSSSIRSPVPLSQQSTRRRKISNQPKIVTEYVRRGTRIITEAIEVPTMQHFAPFLPPETIGIPSKDDEDAYVDGSPIALQLLPEAERFNSFLRFLQADLDSIRSLDSEVLMPVLALRLVVQQLHERSIEVESSKERLLGRWTRKEAHAFLALLGAPASTANAPEEVSERAIQLTAQISSALECIEHLSQVLVLTEAVPNWAHRFSGRAFHALLATKGPLGVSEELKAASEDGLSDCFGVERKSRKSKRKGPQPAQAVPSAKGRTGGIYSLLADL